MIVRDGNDCTEYGSVSRVDALHFFRADPIIGLLRACFINNSLRFTAVIFDFLLKSPKSLTRNQW